MAGRPSKYTQELSDKICHLISTTSKSMRTICNELDIAPQSFLNWLNDKPEFLASYTRAKEQQADFLAEEIIEIADDSSNDTKVIYKDGKPTEVENTEWVSRSKLRVEARKWAAAKLKPKKYGDKLDVMQTIREQPLFGPDVNAE